MPPTEQEDDLDIRLGLIGNGEEIEMAVRAAYETYKRRIVGFVRRQASGLSSDAVADITQETFISLYDAACKGNFDAEQRLLPFLLTLARFRTIDELRRHQRRTRTEEQFVTDMSLYLVGTDAGYEWTQAAIGGRASEIQNLFYAFVATLPPVQRRIAQAVADHLPNDLTDTQIAEVVYERCDERPTVVQIKSAKAQFRMKFKHILNRATNTNNR